MMALGMFVFSLSTLAYQELQRQTEWKHPSTSRVGARDAHQYTSKGDEIITLTDWIAPELTGIVYSLDALRFMTDTGKAWVLIHCARIAPLFSTKCLIMDTVKIKYVPAGGPSQLPDNAVRTHPHSGWLDGC